MTTFEIFQPHQNYNVNTRAAIHSFHETDSGQGSTASDFSRRMDRDCRTIESIEVAHTMNRDGCISMLGEFDKCLLRIYRPARTLLREAPLRKVSCWARVYMNNIKHLRSLNYEYRLVLATSRRNPTSVEVLLLQWRKSQ